MRDEKIVEEDGEGDRPECPSGRANPNHEGPALEEVRPYAGENWAEHDSEAKLRNTRKSVGCAGLGGRAWYARPCKWTG